jgi:hypothetical protein
VPPRTRQGLSAAAGVSGSGTTALNGGVAPWQHPVRSARLVAAWQLSSVQVGLPVGAGYRSTVEGYCLRRLGFAVRGIPETVIMALVATGGAAVRAARAWGRG